MVQSTQCLGILSWTLLKATRICLMRSLVGLTLGSSPEIPVSSTVSTACTKDCLTTALGFLMQTSPTASTSCTLTGTSGLLGSEASPYKDPASHRIVEENRRITESLQDILDCPCSQKDDYLLALIALITLKLVSWYAKIARSSGQQDGSSQQSSRRASNPHRKQRRSK